MGIVCSSVTLGLSHFYQCQPQLISVCDDMPDYDPQQCQALVTASSPVSAVVISGERKEQS